MNPSSSSAGAGPHTACILVVEDDSLLAEILERKLKHEGFLSERATDAEQAQRIIAERGIDLVLLDLVLPGKDGMEFLRDLKRDTKFASIPVVIVSNLVAEEEVAKGLEAGAVAYLTKAETTPDEIIEKVRAVLKKKKKKSGRVMHPTNE